MIDEINAEWEKSDRLTVAKLNAVKQFNKQDHKSKLMTVKYLLLPLKHQFRQLYKICQKSTQILK